MLIVEAALIGCFIYIGTKASITDCINSVIPNQLLMRGAIVLLLLDAMYYGIFAREYLAYALVNLAFVALFAFFLYSFNLWAAGDSKLLFVVTLSIPARYYSYWLLGPFPGFLLVAIIFSVAFLYVIVDSIKQGFRNEDLFDFKSFKFDVKSMLWSYFFMVGVMTICNLALTPLAGKIFSNVGLLITAIDFLIIFGLRQFREKVGEKMRKASTVILWILIILLQFTNIIPRIHLKIDFKAWLIVVMVMLLRFTAEKYNYQEINVDELKPRMIPSAYSVIRFRTSRVNNLPIRMTEDLRSRLSEQEVEAIKRWKNTKQGTDTITIVRKIPFAIFIFIGTMLFLLFEGMIIWRT